MCYERLLSQAFQLELRKNSFDFLSEKKEEEENWTKNE